MIHARYAIVGLAERSGTDRSNDRGMDPVNDGTRVLGNRYEVGELLGRGGMAEVHLGRDTRLGRVVAIKLLRTDLARDPTFQARFRREAQSAAGLNHPAIVAVYDTGEETRHRRRGGTVVALPYIVMEYVEGRTLREMLQRRQHPATHGVALEVTPGCSRRPGLQPPGRHRAPRHQAGQRHADPGRRRQGDGLRHRPGAGRRVVHDDPDPGRDRHRAVPVAGAGPRRDRSTPAATSTPPGACCSSWSPAGRRSSATRRSRWPTSTSGRCRSRRARSTPAVPGTSTGSIAARPRQGPGERYQTAAEFRSDVENARLDAGQLPRCHHGRPPAAAHGGHRVPAGPAGPSRRHRRAAADARRTTTSASERPAHGGPPPSATATAG